MVPPLVAWSTSYAKHLKCHILKGPFPCITIITLPCGSIYSSPRLYTLLFLEIYFLLLVKKQIIQSLMLCLIFLFFFNFCWSIVIKNLPANTGDLKDSGFIPRVRKIPWRRTWQPTIVFLPGKSHRQRNLVGYSPWGRKESDTIEANCTHTCTADLKYCVSFSTFFHVMIKIVHLANSGPTSPPSLPLWRV